MHLAPPGFQTVKLVRTSIFSRWRRRGNPGRRLLRNLGRVCGTSATTSTRTFMWRASAKVCPAASKTWGATPKALPCFFWECKLLLHMPYPGLPWRGAVGVRANFKHHLSLPDSGWLRLLLKLSWGPNCHKWGLCGALGKTRLAQVAGWDHFGIGFSPKYKWLGSPLLLVQSGEHDTCIFRSTA